MAGDGFCRDWRGGDVAADLVAPTLLVVAAASDWFPDHDQLVDRLDVVQRVLRLVDQNRSAQVRRCGTVYALSTFLSRDHRRADADQWYLAGYRFSHRPGRQLHFLDLRRCG